MRTVTALLTRFSLPHPAWKDRPPEAYDAWLTVRLELFARYTVPSVRNLSIKPDCWLIFVGKHTPDFIAGLQAVVAEAQMPMAVVVPYRGLRLPKSISTALATEFEAPLRLCTVRLDSDDAIASDYFGQIASNLKREDMGDEWGISFPGGAVYEAAQNRFSFLCYPDNPFLGYVEKVQDWGNVKTVFNRMHTDLLSHTPQSLYLRSTHPMWCSIVHEHNLANNSLLNGAPAVFSDPAWLRRKFGFSATVSANATDG